MYTPPTFPRWKLTALLAFAAGVALVSAAAGQPEGKARKAPARLNRVVELMEAKQPAFGIFSQNISPRSGASLAGSKLDFVIIDLEHSPYDVSRLETYLLGMTDKRQILDKGNLQPNVVPIVRVPSAGREHLLFVIKQVLDLGPMGVLVPHIDTAADALAMVKAVRFPQLKGSPYFEPAGVRGIGYGWPARQWGLTGAEYAKKADVWPLNPEGEMLLWLMIETQSAVDHIKEIARVPGISGLFIGPSDLAFSMGVPLGDPAVETAMATVLAACKEAGVACGTLDGNVKKRMEQGYQFLAVGGDGGVSGGVTEALRVGAGYRKK